MATISSPGIGSGLDIRSIVNQLVDLEKRPLKQIEKKTELAQLRLSTIGDIKSRVAALDDAMRELTRSSTYRERSFQSGSSAITGTASFTATPANYKLQVNQLARGQSVQSPALASDSLVGAGTLTIDMGTWASGTFTSDGNRSTLTISVEPTDTLTDVARKINDASGAVSASVINDGTGSRLVLRSRATGQNEGFRVQVSDADGNLIDGTGLSRLGYDPQNVPVSSPPTGMVLGQDAQDTVVTIDGIPVRSAGTTLTDAIPGVTLNVSAEMTGTANVQIGQGTETVRKAINAFVEAYNGLESLLSDALRYDPASRAAGPLQGDTTVVTLQASLRRMLSARGPDGRTLSDLGLQLGRDGKLSVNDSRLSAALTNPTTLETAMTASDGVTQGIAQQWRTLTQGLLQEDGRLDLKQTSIEAEINRLKQQQDRINDKASRTEQRLLAQYARLDSTVSRLNALNAYVSQQVTQWNKPQGG